MRVSRRTIVTVGVLGGNFLAAIEATIVATAMPTIVEQLGGLAHYAWVFAAYLLSSTIAMPLWGRLSDLHGRRRFYLAAVALFLAGSVLCGAAGSMEQLVFARAVQGLGAGGLLPLGMTIIGELYTLQERARAQGIFSGVWGVASVLGPMAGGLITETVSWRWVFYLNLPFGALAAVLVGLALVETHAPRRVRIDYLGVATLTGAVGSLLFALTQTGIHDPIVTPASVAACYAAAVILSLLFVAIERRVVEPLLPLDLFADRLVGPALLCSLLIGVSIFGAISFVPLFVQAVQGFSASEAGSVLTPFLVGWVLMSIVSSRLLPRTGSRPMVVSGLTLCSLGFAGLSVADASTSLLVLRVEMGVMGLGMGMSLLSLILSMQNAVSRDRLGIVTSLGGFMRATGGAIGVALLGAIVNAALPASAGVTGPAMASGLHRAFVVSAVLSVLALLSSLGLPAGPHDSRLHPEAAIRSGTVAAALDDHDSPPA